MEKLSYGGVQITNSDNLCKFEDKFGLSYDDEATAYYVSKERFSHEEDDYEFDYRFVVEVCHMNQFDENSKDIYVQLYLVPTFDSLCRDKQESIADSIGYTVDEMLNFVKEGNDYDLCRDVAEYGCSILFGNETCYTDEEVTEKLTAVANVFELMNRMRGFHLDKYVDRIGNTGWDALDEFINNESMFDKVVARVGA